MIVAVAIYIGITTCSLSNAYAVAIYIGITTCSLSNAYIQRVFYRMLTKEITMDDLFLP